MIIDTGATNHFGPLAQTIVDCCPATADPEAPLVRVANGANMQPTHSAQLKLHHKLSPEAQKMFVLDDLAAGTLVSLGQLCDDDCVALFTKYDVTIAKNDHILITGRRTDNGLWSINSPHHESNGNITLQQADDSIPNAANDETKIQLTNGSLPHEANDAVIQETNDSLPNEADDAALQQTTSSLSHEANGIITNQQTNAELAQWLHAAAFSPARSTFISAIQNGHFQSWPGLTEKLVRKHLPPSMAEAKGHLDAMPKNTASTKPNVSFFTPPQEPDNKPTHEIHVALWEHTGRSYSDQTGAFPVQSSRGTKYLFVMYDHDSNYIFVRALKSRQQKLIAEAFESCFNLLKYKGFEPTIHIIDNECGHDIKQAFLKHNIAHQQVPPHQHRVNAAERAIRTFKNHLIAGLATCDPAFPAAEWDRLLQQAEITLNLLRASRRFPSLSAYNAIHGVFDFNKTPLAPPGTKVLVHESTELRGSFDPHGKPGWYIGPALNHYRCYQCFLPSTNGTRNASQLAWFPHSIPFPSMSTDDYLKQTANDMLALLQSKRPNVLSTEFGSTTLNAYRQLATALQRAEPLPTMQPTAAESSSSTTTSTTEPLQRVEPSDQPTTADVQRVPAAQSPLNNEASVQRVPPSPATATPAIKAGNTRRSKRLQHRAPLKPQTNPYARVHHTPRALLRRAQSLAQPTHELQAMEANHIFDETGHKIAYRQLIKGADKDLWTASAANEFGRLLQGIGRNTRKPEHCVQGTDTMRIIHREEVPESAKVTYANFVCDYKPHKEEKYRTRLTVGGDKLTYDDDTTAPSAQLTETKLLLNSVISDHKRNGARFATADIKNFYLNNPLKQFQYMKIHRTDIPSEVWDEYNMEQHVDTNGFIHFEIQKGMYGLKEAGIVAWTALKQHLQKYGYTPVNLTTGLWRHATRKTIFVLTVDDFGIKYANWNDLQHLLNALKDKYMITEDTEGKQYCGLTIDWNYTEGYVDISMPGYIDKTLRQYAYTPSTRPQHAPHQWQVPVYGRKRQDPTTYVASPQLDAKRTKRLQSIAGKLLYYARAVDSSMLVALNEISSQQAHPTEATERAIHMLLDYAATHPDAKVRYRASDMILHIDTDAAFLVMPTAKSRVSAYYYMGEIPKPAPAPPTSKLNGAILVDCLRIKKTVASAAEAETHGIFNAGRKGRVLRQALIEMGHPQPDKGTPIKTDNASSYGVMTETMRSKLSKFFDMEYWWMKDAIKANEFNLYWQKGSNNWADYTTKHHPPAHHKAMRSHYFVTKQQELNSLTDTIMKYVDVRGCVSPRSHHGDLSANVQRLQCLLAVQNLNLAGAKRPMPNVQRTNTNLL